MTVEMKGLALNHRKKAKPIRNHLIYWPALSILFLSSTAMAHVRWFVTNEGEHINSQFIFDDLSVGIVTLFFSFILLCVTADILSASNLKVKMLLYKPLFKKQYTTPILQISVAILLIANLLQKIFVAPNFIACAASSLQLFSQFILLLTLIINVNVFSYLLAVFSLTLFITFPFECAIDYSVELLAIAACMFFTSSNRQNKMYSVTFLYFQYRNNGTDFGLMFLRIGLAMQLMILTVHDKLLHPGLALHFLDLHAEFNFPHSLGISNFKDIHFVLAAGLAELSFGLILAINYSARISLGFILFFFFLTGCLLDLDELIGHIPILAAAFILFSYPKEGAISLLSIKQTHAAVS